MCNMMIGVECGDGWVEYDRNYLSIIYGYELNYSSGIGLVLAYRIVNVKVIVR
jgi:hypothetical protein